MRIIVDTNVLMSGIFWSGSPKRILDAWKIKKLTLVLTESIFAEYRRIAEIFSAKRASTEDLVTILELITIYGELHPDHQLPTPVSADPDDDKFLACAVSAGVKMIISGDRDLLDVSPYGDIEVLNPRTFVDRFLN